MTWRGGSGFSKPTSSLSPYWEQALWTNPGPTVSQEQGKKEKCSPQQRKTQPSQDSWRFFEGHVTPFATEMDLLTSPNGVREDFFQRVRHQQEQTLQCPAQPPSSKRAPALPDTNSQSRTGPIGGWLLGFVDQWERITSDSWILQTVSQGYHLEFQRTSKNRYWKVPLSKEPHKYHKMLKVIDHLLNINAIEPVPQAQRGKGVYSIFFLVP